MNGIGDKEKATQNRLLKLITDLGYTNLGNLSKQHNTNIDTAALTAHLQARGYENGVIKRAIYELQLLAGDQTKSLYERNKNVYTALRYGIQVKPDQGQVKETVWLVDWNNPDNNTFSVAEEVTVRPTRHGGHEKRPDIVISINGIVVAVIELKRSTVSLAEGIRQTLDNQKPEFIEEFFSTVQWVFAGNDTEGLRYATIQTPERYWMTWKEEGQPAPQNPLDEPLAHLLDKARFLELLHDFIVFDMGVKKLPRPHQYFGVKAAQVYANAGNNGIIWHTQGSGKSLTMVWLAKWIKENIEDARILIVTDREELDDQIQGVFNGVGENIYRTSSGSALLAAIGGTLTDPKHGPAPSITCSLIHKFGSGVAGDELTADMIEQAASNLTPQGRFFVFVDEAHRTQSGILHEAMRKLIPEATFIGFTGTPLLKRDKTNSQIAFGPFIHTYRYDEAVKDKVVLDLRYEARDVEQKVGNQKKIDAWFDAKTKALSDQARATLKQRWATMQKVFSSKSRLEMIVADILLDFQTKPRLSTNKGNALLVAGSVYEACRYYELFSGTELKGKVAIITSYDPAPSAIKGETTGEGDTESIQKYDIYRKMLASWFNVSEDEAAKRVEEFEDQVKATFVKEPGQMKLLIVVDKLLTGFDAPPATFLYIDKSMKDHGLFQAICRVNRLDPAAAGEADSKDYGYVVDYKDLFASLADAVTDYTDGAFADFDAEDVAGLLTNQVDQIKKRLTEARDQVLALVEPVQRPKGRKEHWAYFCPDENLDEEQNKGRGQLRSSFYKAVGAYTRAWAELAADAEAAGLTPTQIDRYSKEVAHYNALRQELLLASGDGLDLKLYEPGMRQLIDTYIQAEDSTVLSDLDNKTFLELLAKDPDAAVEKLPADVASNENAAAEVIEANVRKVIVDSNPTNPKYFQSMSAVLVDLIKRRRSQVLSYKEYLEKMAHLAEQVQDPSKSDHYPKALTSRAEQALYDTLAENEELASAVYQEFLGTAQDGWTSNPVKTKKVRIDLQTFLTDYGVTDETVLDDVMKVLSENGN